eukprot:CAMPEP_0182452282 /NCGR_PEP_ID=MMETSP1172-20130603/44169_1 /TAXON_ID=708627 /ORGANISM="Timspurckia oligopyrenoides, Strain CCMP3278" /LENGTH=306 /DNA_ID=CAMNT_0024650107 /DNA_START=211 /DNA_END=1131 /DNA_ORIENTATION=+
MKTESGGNKDDNGDAFFESDILQRRIRKVQAKEKVLEDAKKLQQLIGNSGMIGMAGNPNTRIEARVKQNEGSEIRIESMWVVQGSWTDADALYSTELEGRRIVLGFQNDRDAAALLTKLRGGQEIPPTSQIIKKDFDSVFMYCRAQDLSLGFVPDGGIVLEKGGLGQSLGGSAFNDFKNDDSKVDDRAETSEYRKQIDEIMKRLGSSENTFDIELDDDSNDDVDEVQEAINSKREVLESLEHLYNDVDAVSGAGNDQEGDEEENEAYERDDIPWPIGEDMDFETFMKFRAALDSDEETGNSSESDQ